MNETEKPPLHLEKNIKDFLKEYFEQDNLCTAHPIYFQIRDIEYIPSIHFDESNRFVLVINGESTFYGADLDEIFTDLCADDDITIPGGMTADDIDGMNIEFIRVNDFESAEIFGENKSHVYKRMFLLKSEADQHLKLNHYHYSSEAIVFCCHAWRANRQEKFLNNLAEYFDIKTTKK